MKKLTKALAIIAALCMIASLAAACDGSAKPSPSPTPTVAATTAPPAKDPEPTVAPPVETDSVTEESGALFTPYDEEVVISVGKISNIGGTFMPGEDAENNAHNTMYKDILNIKVDVTKNGFDIQPGDTYTQAISLRSASGTLPDTFQIQGNNSKDYTFFKTLVGAGMLADLTGPYSEIVGLVKDYTTSADAAEINKFMTVNGKLYGLTGGGEGFNRPVLWVRNDWLKDVGMSAPKTLEDIEAVALAFIEKKPGGQANTIGIPINPDGGGYDGQWLGVGPIFNAFGSYPDQWVSDGAGGAVYSAITPETKEALALLADWYQKGILDKDLLSKKNGDEERDAFLSVEGAGMLFQAWWDPWPQWADLQAASVKTNQKTDWIPVMAPLNKAGKFAPKNERLMLGGQVVTAKCEHPEAVVRMANLMTEVDQLRNPQLNDIREKYIVPTLGIADGRTMAPISTALYANQGRLIAAEVVNDFKATGVLNLDPRVADAQDRIVASVNYGTDNSAIKKWYETGDESLLEACVNEYVGYKADDLCGNLFLSNVNSGVYEEMSPAFIGATDSYEDYKSVLDDLQNTTFKQIITGNKPIDAFDEFVAQWKQLGGDILTSEVNASLR